jgi:hypothetical protein
VWGNINLVKGAIQLFLHCFNHFIIFINSLKKKTWNVHEINEKNNEIMKRIKIMIVIYNEKENNNNDSIVVLKNNENGENENNENSEEQFCRT